MVKISELLAAGPTFSFEFFPPKSDDAQLTLGHTIADLEPLGPSFVSVTYGAGGSTRDRTRQVVRWVRRETDITPMAHLTCVGHTRAEIAEILADYAEVGIENIMALGGDPPADGSDPGGDFEHATDLVEFVKSEGDFCVGVAAHPEGHPRSGGDLASDRRWLAYKLELADFAVTQFFFETHHYVEMVAAVRAAGIDKAIIPGIMPVTNPKRVNRMAELSGAEFPRWLAEALESAPDPAAARAVGIEVATNLCRDLLELGAPGLHFYTLNRSSATREIYRNLELATSDG